MNKNIIVAIGVAAVVVIGVVVYGNLKVIDPMTEEAAMTTEMMTEAMTEEAMMSEEMTDESMAAGEAVATTEMMSDEAAMTTEMMPDVGSMMNNEGEAAPAFDLMDVSGNAVSLESLKGERVYVKFWASWCSICLAGMEELNELSANAEDFKVITIVSPDFNGEQSSDDFIKWYGGLDYENITVLLDPDGDIAKEYGVRGYPTSAYIGSDGILVKQLPGHVDNAKIIESFMTIY